MQRLVLVLLAALVLAPAALAKEATVTMIGGGPPGGIDAGTPWSADVKLTMDQQAVPSAFPAPTMQLLNLDTGRSLEVAMTPTKTLGVYHADVVFPQKGNWAYSVREVTHDRAFQLGQVSVAPKGGAPTGGGGDFPTLPAIGVAFFALVALTSAALVAHSRRLRPATR
jgi:hypothetical protein